ncbi:MAG: hypothetical protein ACPGMQ_06285 [Pirellulales bacterium]|jgi:hypothetical protein
MLRHCYGTLLVLFAATLCLGCGQKRVIGPAPDMVAALELREALEKGSGSDGKTEEKAQGTGWASLRGKFIFAGSPGAPKALVVDKDTAVCSKDGMQLFEQSLIVDESSKGLANVVVFLRKSSRVKNESATEKLVMDQKNCEFLTPVFAARVGQAVDVKNSDPIGHNTNISGSSFNQLIPSGDSTVFTPSRETGLPVSVTCNIHPWMKAYAVFRKDGYVAVSSGDGTFEIPDLPAGEPLEFQVWHERATGRSGALDLDQPELKWNSKGRFKITLKENEVRDLGTLEIPADAISG